MTVQQMLLWTQLIDFCKRQQEKRRRIFLPTDVGDFDNELPFQLFIDVDALLQSLQFEVQDTEDV